MIGFARRHPEFACGLGLIVLALLPTLLTPVTVGFAAGNIFAGVPNLPPGIGHPLGTQSEGRDMLAVLGRAAPATLFIGLIGGGMSLIVGGALGLLAGYLGGWQDAVIRTLADVGLTIPPLAILILVGAAFPTVSVAAMGLVIAATIWMSTARVIRSQTLTLREREYTRVARMSGAGHLRIAFGEILPNLFPYLAACFVNGVTTSMLAAIGLEMLGLGPGQSQTLGSVVFESLTYSAMWRGLWWWWAPAVAVMALFFLGLFLLSLSLDSGQENRTVQR